MLTAKRLDLSKLIIQTSGVESALLMRVAKWVNTVWQKNHQYITDIQSSQDRFQNKMTEGASEIKIAAYNVMGPSVLEL